MKNTPRSLARHFHKRKLMRWWWNGDLSGTRSHSKFVSSPGFSLILTCHERALRRHGTITGPGSFIGIWLGFITDLYYWPNASHQMINFHFTIWHVVDSRATTLWWQDNADVDGTWQILLGHNTVTSALAIISHCSTLRSMTTNLNTLSIFI